MHKRLLVLFFLLSGCFKSSEPAAVERVEVQTIAREVQIPQILMADLEVEIRNESKTIAPVYLFMPIEVQFVEYNDGILKSPNMKFSLPKGGGTVDLKDVVTGFGSFYMRFPPEQFENMSENKPELLHLYYISNSPTKKIENETFGLGCGKMIDLKKSFSKLQNANFLKLNTSDLRYLYVTAGRYVFIFQQSMKIYMAQLTITDSRYFKELCLGADF